MDGGGGREKREREREREEKRESTVPSRYFFLVCFDVSI